MKGKIFLFYDFPGKIRLEYYTQISLYWLIFYHMTPIFYLHDTEFQGGTKFKTDYIYYLELQKFIKITVERNR